MKRLALIACCVCLQTPVLAASSETVNTITTLRGRSYHNCRISQVHPDGVSFFHANGAAKVLFTELPESMKKKFGYSKQRAEEYQRELATRQFLERERLENARQEEAERRRLDMDARLLMLERMAMLQEQRLLLQQRQMAFGGFPAIAAPVPAVGFPATFYGPLNEIHGPAFGGSRWCRSGSRLASVGCGSGGVLGWGGSGLVHCGYGGAWASTVVGGYLPGRIGVSVGCGSGGVLGWGRSGNVHGGIWTSPTLGSYVPGRFGAFGGVGLGGGCSIGFTGLNYLGTPPAAACAPVRMGGAAVPVVAR